MKTYWLYNGNEPLTAVRLPEGASDQDARCAALWQFNEHPGMFSGITRGAIIFSEIKTFPGER